MASGTITANGSTDWLNINKSGRSNIVMLLNFGGGTVTLQATPDGGTTVFDIEAYTADTAKIIDSDELQYRLTTTNYSSNISWYIK